MATIRIKFPSRATAVGDGDMEGAFIRAGFPRLESAEIASAFPEFAEGMDFKTSKLSKAGIDPQLLVSELRAAGFDVVWKD